MEKKLCIFLKVPTTCEWSLNQIYSGLHFNARKKHKDEIRQRVSARMRKMKKEGEWDGIPFKECVRLIFEYGGKLDVSNYAYLSKMIEDSLVKSKVLLDDRVGFVSEIITRRQKSFKGVIVTIEEVMTDAKT